MIEERRHPLRCVAVHGPPRLAHASCFPPPPRAAVRPTGHSEHNLRLVSKPTPHAKNNVPCLVGRFQTGRQNPHHAQLLEHRCIIPYQGNWSKYIPACPLFFFLLASERGRPCAASPLPELCHVAIQYC